MDDLAFISRLLDTGMRNENIALGYPKPLRRMDLIHANGIAVENEMRSKPQAVSVRVWSCQPIGRYVESCHTPVNLIICI